MNAKSLLTCCVIACQAALCRGQTFDQVPYVTCQNRSDWAAIFSGASATARRIAILGDSQETSPGGNGQTFIPRMNWEAWRTYGHTPETAIRGSISYGGGTPPGEWLTRGGAVGAATALSDLAASYWLPDVGGTLSRYQTTDSGALWMLQPRGDSLGSDTQLSDVDDYWDKSIDTYADIFLYTLTGGNPGLTVYVRPNTTSTGNYFATATQTFNETDLNLDDPTGTAVKYTTIALNWNSLAFQQVIVLPYASGAGDALVVGCRFRSATSKGIAFSSFSAGGYKATDLLATHANSGPMLKLMGPWDAVWLCYGGNDASNDVSAATFKANVQTLISTLRGASWLNNQTQKFIITTDGYNANITAAQRTQAELMPDAAAEIAEADANVLAINEYRIMYDAGLTPAGYATYLSDGVHHNGLGARTRAALLWNALNRLTVHNEGRFR